MKYLLNSEEMKTADYHTIHRFHVPPAVLMERAAAAVVALIKGRGYDGASFGVICGTGNNGGDGIAVARMLREQDCNVRYLVVGSPQKGTPDFELQLKIAEAYRVPRVDFVRQLESCDVYIDAMFGVGLSRDIGGEYAQVLREVEAMEGWKIAVDIPSGVCSDDGRIMGTALHCDDTVTFAFGKAGCFLYPGKACCGNVHICDIGITKASLSEQKPSLTCMEPKDLGCIPGRLPDAHKGSCGKVLVIAGSEGMSGAAYFCAKSAYLCGCGLVRIVTPECNRTILQTLLPEAVLEVCDGTMDEEPLQRLTDWADAIVIGPGLGRKERSEYFVEKVTKYASAPLVCDADALNILAGHMEWLDRCESDVVVTPHFGEMGRLCDKGIAEIKENRLETARRFAREHSLTCVLKDAATITAFADGSGCVNDSGNPGMATAGSGDVLSGIIGGLIAQGTDLHEAVPLGVYIHGLAGDRAAADRGIRGMTASDIMDALPGILMERGV